MRKVPAEKRSRTLEGSLVSHISIETQTLLEFLLDHYVVSMDKRSLKSEGRAYGGSLVSWYRHISVTE
jgi:hypothetical protein